MKFSTFIKLSLKITTAVVLISCMVSIANSSKKTVKTGSLVVNNFLINSIVFIKKPQIHFIRK